MSRSPSRAVRPSRAVLVVVLLLVSVLAGCSGGKDAVSRDSFQFVSPGGKTDIFYEGTDRKKLPQISGDDLMREGAKVSLSDFPGQVVVINLWGQWCGPCRSEAPEMEKVYQQTKGAGATVLGIDVQDENRQAPQDFVRNRNLTYPSIYDPPGRSLLRLSGYPRNVVPSTLVVDKQHRVAAVFLRDLLAEDLLPVVQRLTAER